MSSHEPHAIRSAWAARMMTRFEAEAASIYGVRYDPESDCVRLSDAQFIGSPEFASFGRAVDGSTTLDWEANPEQLATLNDATPYAESDIPAAMRDVYWRPFGLRSAISISGVVEGEFTGNFNVFRTRTQSQPDYGPQDLKGSARAWVTATLDMLAHTHAMITSSSERGMYLFDDAGQPWMSSDAHASASMERLRELAAAFIRSGEPERESFLEHAKVRFTRLHGSESSAVAAIVSPTVPVEIPAFVRLTLTQRKIASYAVHGATMKEIAAAMGRSRDTIKSHLARVYSELGIGSRAELAALYHAAHDWSPKRGAPD